MPLSLQPLSSTTAHLLGLFFASTYVGSIYISKHSRLIFANVTPTSTPTSTPTGTTTGTTSSATRERQRARRENEQWRDDPDVIRSRLKAVSLATLISLLAVWALVSSLYEGEGDHDGGDEGGVGGVTLTLKTLKHTINLLGLSISFPPPKTLQSLQYAVLPHLVTPLLFLGPLYVGLRTWDRDRWSVSEYFRDRFWNIFGVRNYILAPITEELVFRSCILASYLLSPTLASSPIHMIFVTPLNFGVAHLHHAWDTYNRYGRTKSALKRAILTSLFQLTYTTLFGAHCAFLFLATRSIFPSLSAHVFCNIMGVPNFGGDVRRFGWSVGGVYLVGIGGFGYAVGGWGRGWWCARESLGM